MTLLNYIKKLAENTEYAKYSYSIDKEKFELINSMKDYPEVKDALKACGWSKEELSYYILRDLGVNWGDEIYVALNDNVVIPGVRPEFTYGINQTKKILKDAQDLSVLSFYRKHSSEFEDDMYHIDQLREVFRKKSFFIFDAMTKGQYNYGSLAEVYIPKEDMFFTVRSEDLSDISSPVIRMQLELDYEKNVLSIGDKAIIKVFGDYTFVKYNTMLM